MSKDKIKTLQELKVIVDNLKKQGKKIVQCHGCFDFLHVGHLKHFESAKKQGDILVVTITPDIFIEKGPGRPFYHQDLRLDFLSAIEYIDYIALNQWPTAIETIKLICPDVYVKGKEVLKNSEIDELNKDKKKVSNLAAEEEALNSVGGVLYLTDEITFSSSSMINKITSAIPDESRDYLNILRKKYSAEDMINLLKSLENIKILVIGDSILDEYIYCKSMEKSGKESLISYKFINSETHLGGVFAIANHISGFAKNTSILTCIGKNTYEFIECFLGSSIERNIFVEKDLKTIIKTRFIDDYKLNKLFSIYNTDELSISEDTEEKILRYLEKNLGSFELVIVSDFGHGLITPKILDYLCNSNKFLAVNCQLNAGNLGYNFITKYKRADFISMNDREIRLPFQEKKGDIKEPVLKLSKILNAKKINITLGKSGMIYFKDGDFFHSPSFTKEPLDTIGSGDAVFALTSMLSYKEVEPELLPFLGNCIGGLATKIIGNKRAVSPIELKKFVSYILK